MFSITPGGAITSKSSVGSGPLPLEAALDALEAAKLSKSDQQQLVETLLVPRQKSISKKLLTEPGRERL